MKEITEKSGGLGRVNSCQPMVTYEHVNGEKTCESEVQLPLKHEIIG